MQEDGEKEPDRIGPHPKKPAYCGQAIGLRWGQQDSALEAAEEAGPLQLTSSCQRSFHKIPDVGEQGVAAVIVEFWEPVVIPNRFLLAGLVSTKGHCSEKSSVSAGQTEIG